MSENDPYSLYTIVPVGFNLLRASPEELLSYGIPQKPDAIAAPSLFRFWEKLVSPPFLASKPTFDYVDRPIPTESLNLMSLNLMRRDFLPSRGGRVESSLNWSGAIVSPPWPKRIIFAASGWKAPQVSRPSATALFTHANVPKTLVWVGLDGHNARLPKVSLPQIGTGHWPDGQPQHFAWWDWWCHSPRKQVTRIADFPVDAGDEILAGLAVLVSGDVLFFIKNQSNKGEFRSFLAKRQALPDIEQLGSSAEWVVERPTNPHSGKFYPLAAYGSVDFKYCMALAADAPLAPGPRLMTLADNGRMIKMREAFADPYRTCYVSRTERRRDSDRSIGITCTFHEPT